MVRQRSRPGQGPGKAKRALCRKDSSGSVSEIPVGKDEGLYNNNVFTLQFTVPDLSFNVLFSQ